MDFLYHVFASVLDEPAVGRGMKRLRGGLERGGEGGDGDDGGDGGDGGEESDEGTAAAPAVRTTRSRRVRSGAAGGSPASPRATRRHRGGDVDNENTDFDDDKLRSHSEEASDGLLDTIRAGDEAALKEAFERALEHIDFIKRESKRLEEAALSVGSRRLARVGGGRVQGLVRCVACGKTVGSRAMGVHRGQCGAGRGERDKSETGVTMETMETMETMGTETEGTGYTNDTGREDVGGSMGVRGNIAPIAIARTGGRGGSLLSPLGAQSPFGLQYSMMNMVPSPLVYAQAQEGEEDGR